MVIVGAGGHASEILKVINFQHEEKEYICFFDDVHRYKGDVVFGSYDVISHTDQMPKIFEQDQRFILGVGKPKTRYTLAKKFLGLGGKLHTLIAKTAVLGNFELELAEGLNIMDFVSINNKCGIGKGCLVNSFVSIHHDSQIGEYCELAPRVSILGGAIIGDYTFLGAHSVVLPNVKIGRNCLIGAGTIVNRDLPDDSVVYGVPGRVIKKNLIFEDL